MTEMRGFLCSVGPNLSCSRFQVLHEHMDRINNHDLKKQNGNTEKWGIKVVLPLVETEDDVNSSESEWEEEAEKLCNWSKQLDIEDVQTPELI